MSTYSGAFLCPNITGQIRNVSETFGSGDGTCSGAFSKEGASLNRNTPDGLDAGPTGIINLNASWSSSFYGKSSSIQPASIRLLSCIKF